MISTARTGELGRHPLSHDIVFFVALLATAIALGGGLAHLLSLPNKISMPQADYFAAQQAYRGWQAFAFVLVVQLASMVTLTVQFRKLRGVFLAVIAAILCLLLAQVVFWIYTFPANVATENWTVVPPNWADLRAQWEYSHAVGALLQLLAMSALILAALMRARGSAAMADQP